MQRSVRRLIVSLPPISDQSIAHQIARVMTRVKMNDWSYGDVDTLKSRAEDDNFEFSEAVERVVAHHHPIYRDGLLSRIGEGDVQALSAWGDVRDLPPEATRGMIHASAAATRAETLRSNGGAFAFGGSSAFRRLILLNIWHPDLADWTLSVEALGAEQLNPSQILPGRELMILQAESISQDCSRRDPWLTSKIVNHTSR